MSSKNPLKKKKVRASTTSLRIGVATALFNSEITLKLEEGALRVLKRAGVNPKNVYAVKVPGAFELPLIAQKLLSEGRCDGVVVLGAIIRGETDHYQYVCEAAEQGCLRVSLDSGKPVGFGVLTIDNEDQAKERVGGRHGHKGEETAKAVLEMCNLLKIL